MPAIKSYQLIKFRVDYIFVYYKSPNKMIKYFNYEINPPKKIEFQERN
jgi:hypothetical protein